MKLMDPTVPSAAANNVRAPRLANLQGATVGLLSNMKLNADVLLRETAELFVQRHDCQVAELVVKHNASAPAGDERIDRVVNQCDFMLTAMGDWGSCSTCSLHDGISFEQRGKRAVVLCTHPFEVTARNIARVMGLPDYPFVMVDHPIGSLQLPEIQARAEDAYRQALPILLEGWRGAAQQGCVFSALLRSGRGASYLLEPQREDDFALIVRTRFARDASTFRKCLAAQDVCLRNAERKRPA